MEVEKESRIFISLGCTHIHPPPASHAADNNSRQGKSKNVQNGSTISARFDTAICTPKYKVQELNHEQINKDVITIKTVLNHLLKTRYPVVFQNNI